jgi:hypothetical protein
LCGPAILTNVFSLATCHSDILPGAPDQALFPIGRQFPNTARRGGAGAGSGAGAGTRRARQRLVVHGRDAHPRESLLSHAHTTTHDHTCAHARTHPHAPHHVTPLPAPPRQLFIWDHGGFAPEVDKRLSAADHIALLTTWLGTAKKGMRYVDVSWNTVGAPGSFGRGFDPRFDRGVRRAWAAPRRALRAGASCSRAGEGVPGQAGPGRPRGACVRACPGPCRPPTAPARRAPPRPTCMQGFWLRLLPVQLGETELVGGVEVTRDWVKDCQVGFKV